MIDRNYYQYLSKVNINAKTSNKRPLSNKIYCLPFYDFISDNWKKTPSTSKSAQRFIIRRGTKIFNLLCNAMLSSSYLSPLHRNLHCFYIQTGGGGNVRSVQYVRLINDREKQIENNGNLLHVPVDIQNFPWKEWNNVTSSWPTIMRSLLFPQETGQYVETKMCSNSANTARLLLKTVHWRVCNLQKYPH